ncbi:MAG: hypothetical protein ABL921_15305 [Pirellula sp.]
MRSLSWFLAIACTLFWRSIAIAQTPPKVDCEAADLLPKTIVALAEVSNLGIALQTILNHPLRTKLEALPAYTAFMQSGQPKWLQVAVKAFEASVEQTWQQAVATLGDRGVFVALDATDGGVAALVHSSDDEVLERFRSFVVAARMLQGGNAKQGDYRGLKVDSLNDNLKMVRIHDWLLLTNKSELGKSIVDRYLDQGNESLAKNDKYAKAITEVKSGESKRLVSAYVDIEKLRNAGVAKGLFNERVDNFVAELLVGGVLANLRKTDYATAALDLNQSGLSLHVSTPHQRDWEPPRAYFFGSSELAAAPGMLNVNHRLFALSAHRDISQMWLRCGDLLTDKANDQLAVADTQLTTFFSGRDFGEDILGSLESDVQIVGKVQDFASVLPQPTIKLPAFAIEFQMKNPEETRNELRRVFQAFVGFVNITGSMNGRPQLDLGLEKEGNVQFVTATYLPKHDQRESLDATIEFNFSPTLAFSGKRVVLSSSTPLARELLAPVSLPQNDKATVAKETDAGATDANAAHSNTIAMLDARVLQQILQTNRPQLVANNMLEKGHSKEAAESEIGLLLELAGFFRDARLSLDVTEAKLTFAAQVNVNIPKTANHD